MRDRAHLRHKQFTITYDILVRGGVTLKSAYVGSSAVSGEDDPHGGDFVTCSRGVKIIPDLRLPDLAGGKALEEYDAIVVPGGNKGAEIISSNEDVTKLIGAFFGKGKIVACICAGEVTAAKELIFCSYYILQDRWQRRQRGLAKMQR